MELAKLIEIARDEASAEEFLRKKGILKTFTCCVYCSNKPFGKARRNVYKCYRCKREWSIRKGSILEKTKVSFSKLLMVLKLFELEVPVLRASKELGLAYKQFINFLLLREHIYRATSKDNLLSGEADESYFGGRRKGNRGRGARNKIPVFGIL